MWGNKEMFENYKGFKMKFIGQKNLVLLLLFPSRRRIEEGQKKMY